MPMGLAVIVLIALAPGAAAQSPGKPPVFTAFKSKLALDGHDPVAYFREGKPVKGNPAQALSWNGATWHFASAENKAAFEANPHAFAPQYGGYCAWAVSRGYTAKGDPTAWKVVGGKLYLNYDAKVQQRWAADIPGNIGKADRNWPKALEK